MTAEPDEVRPGVPATDEPGSGEPTQDTLDEVHARPGTDELHAAIEGVLMIVDDPVPALDLAGVLGVPTELVTEALGELAAEYRGERGGRRRGFELREVGGGWRIYSSPAVADVVGRFVVDGQTARLTQASLETLAVIAYRQPVTRGRVAAVRGVNVDGVVRTLLARGLVAEAGPAEEGGAMTFRTTTAFLERMGLSSLDELPPLAPYLPDLGADGVDPTEGAS
ncbi:SMC-Scp complex subunit ScpB [Georgenia sp. Z1344]|uniref:SMC-Scp complex subunit ScpB n=1 Tax=Georgenia sp. Z1344 TaxID=3416706 RepID=UPI003CEDF4CC